MTTFDKLADLFREFPGIGPRQAKRFVYFLLSRDAAFLDELTNLISVLKNEIIQCSECFRFFARRGSAPLCPICSDASRATGELMVVAKDTDLEAMEKSHTYGGNYFVLGGTISLMEKKNGDVLRLKELVERVSRSVIPATPTPHPRRLGSSPPAGELGIQSSGLKEVILALSANPDGEHTADELKLLLAPYALKISTLGRGLSTGSELEYADTKTLKSALKNRSS